MGTVSDYLEKEILFMEAVLNLYEEGRKEQFEIELSHLQRMLEKEIEREQEAATSLTPTTPIEVRVNHNEDLNDEELANKLMADEAELIASGALNN